MASSEGARMLMAILLASLLPIVPLATHPAASAASLVSASPVVAVVDSVTVETYSPQRLPFTVRFGDAENDYRVMAMFVLPNETVPLSVASAASFDVSTSQGAMTLAGPNAWHWTAPMKPGLYPIEVADRATGQSMTLNVFVMVPFADLRGGLVHGYPIGRYPRVHSEFYEHPRCFVLVTPELRSVEVSPHLTLGQFVCKQPGGPPEYLVLRQPLLAKLEEVLAEVNERGREAHGFSLLSAYRTPLYSAA